MAHSLDSFAPSDDWKRSALGALRSLAARDRPAPAPVSTATLRKRPATKRQPMGSTRRSALPNAKTIDFQRE
jgi:hypothetical protein